jgi:biopolymer transport protein ExbB
MRPFLEQLSEQSTLLIAVLGGLHLLAFLMLGLWYRGRLRRLATLLDDFTRGVRHRSILDRGAFLGDQVEAFIADIREIVENPERSADRTALTTRVLILDERRDYLRSLGFDTTYNVARAMIEAYPLLGILGTILAIGLAIDTPGATSVAVIVQRFGQAIWSTCAGLVAGLVLLFLNSLYEPAVIRLSEQQHQVRDMVGRVKSLLMTHEARSGLQEEPV